MSVHDMRIGFSAFPLMRAFRPLAYLGRRWLLCVFLDDTMCLLEYSSTYKSRTLWTLIPHSFD